MHKKVEIFLMVMVVIWFVLLADATKNRGASEPVLQPQTSTTASAEIDTPATELTETTAPEEEPAPSLVEAALAGHTLTGTAVTHLVRVGDPGVALAADLAESVGFEPTVPCGITGFQDRLVKPLRQLSITWIL